LNTPGCQRRSAALFALLAAGFLLLPSALLGTSIAVLRGQKTVDRSILPLVCFEIGTVGTPLVLERVVLENMDTHAEETRVLANSFGSSHPDILTAAAPGPVSLSLPIMRFQPGRYRLKSISFVGPGSGYALDLSSAGIWFEVKPACVNYVGGIEITADWAYLFQGANRKLQYNEVNRVSVRSSVVCKNTVARDVRWACDQVPGMLPLPSVVSPVAGK
jgi:hypothetical protein